MISDLIEEGMGIVKGSSIGPIGGGDRAGPGNLHRTLSGVSA
jgi:hypothetical protein